MAHAGHCTPTNTAHDGRQHLERIFQYLKAQDIRKIDNTVATQMGLIRGRLPKLPVDVPSDSQRQNHRFFFDPWTVQRVNELPPDIREAETVHDIQLHERILRKMSPEYPDIGTVIGSVMCHEFAAYIRVDKTTGEVYCGLAEAAGWQEGDCDDRFLLDQYAVYSNIGDSEAVPWVIDITEAYFQDDKPHVMFTAVQHGPHNEALLRTELLAIMGVMLTRLKLPALREHKVIPVNAVSFFDDFKARVLQAHMTDGELAISWTGGYDFSTEDSRRESTQAMLAYMASRPIGNTKILNYTGDKNREIGALRSLSRDISSVLPNLA
ncbi:hypothetical protein BJX70DRAFT_396098 [Aspergillus crustosus]